LTKGQRAYVEGRLRTRSWEGQDGQRHSRIEIIANRVLFLDKRPAGTLPEGGVEAGAEAGAEDDLDPGDIPF
jgi:single-strand DNA-binding protein